MVTQAFRACKTLVSLVFCFFYFFIGTDTVHYNLLHMPNVMKPGWMKEMYKILSVQSESKNAEIAFGHAGLFSLIAASLHLCSVTSSLVLSDKTHKIATSI